MAADWRQKTEEDIGAFDSSLGVEGGGDRDEVDTPLLDKEDELAPATIWELGSSG